MRGMRKQQYLNSFVMVNNDIDQGNTTAQGSCHAASADTLVFDDSLVSHTTIEEFKLVGSVQTAARAL